MAAAAAGTTAASGPFGGGGGGSGFGPIGTVFGVAPDSSSDGKVTLSTDVGGGKANQTITFPSPGRHAYGDAPFALSATASSGLPVTYATSGPCSVSGSTMTITGFGRCSVTASQGGNASFHPALPVTRLIVDAVTFGFTEGEQQFEVPAGVTQISAALIGAQGSSATGAGGIGGQATATLTVTPGTVFDVIVGGKGGPLTEDGDCNQAEGGFNGGGQGGFGCDGAGGGGAGGGATTLRVDGQSNPVLVAGGGGGGGGCEGGNCAGGSGGGLVGGSGGGAGGAGGNQTGTSGSGERGNGSDGHPGFPEGGGGGGGGGYYGGAGDDDGGSGGGGGGSGFGPSGTVFGTASAEGGNGKAVLSFVVEDGATKTVVSASPNPARAGQGVTLTATVSRCRVGRGRGVGRRELPHRWRHRGDERGAQRQRRRIDVGGCPASRHALGGCQVPRWVRREPGIQLVGALAAVDQR